MEFQHPMFTRNGQHNLKEIKRGNQPKKNEQDEDAGPIMDDSGIDGGAAGPAAKKARTDYSAFKSDVARLQKNLDAFEQDMKEHTMQVQMKLACTPPPAPEPHPPAASPRLSATAHPPPYTHHTARADGMRVSAAQTFCRRSTTCLSATPWP